MRVVALDWKQLFIYLNIREVANAHIAAARSPWAEGRYILAEKNMTTLAEMSTMLRKVHRYPLLLSAQLAGDDVLDRFGGCRGITCASISEYFTIDDRPSIEELGLTYRPIEETLIDHFRSWSELRYDRSDPCCQKA